MKKQNAYQSVIPVYQDVIEEICPLITKNHSLAALYVSCSKINIIERRFGKKIYLDILKKIHNLLLDLKGKEIRKNDIIVSHEKGGVEFIIFLSKKRDDRHFCSTDLESLCDRMSDFLNEKISRITFQYLRGRPNIGVGYAVILSNPLIREERLVSKLIDDAKLMSTYQEFKKKMRNKEKLQELILKESIRTVFQPIVDLTKNEIYGYEALTRGPEGTEYESPYVIFDIAEETEMLFELDSLCRKTALRNARGIDSKHKLFINCLPSAVLDPEFKDAYLKTFLEDLKLNPHNIVLEVTEREAIENFDLFTKAIEYYSDIGFSIAVDDMGAGYSSLETIVELKPEYIKLDISLVRGIDKNILKQELIKSIVSLAKQMNSRVIGEGIETEAELKSLKEIGVELGQGFLFAKPAPPFPDINF